MIRYRPATTADAQLLARLNHELIRDEGHANRMSPAELRLRVEGWLRGEYQAVIFEDETGEAGYALFRHEADFVYLRQFYVTRLRRRLGIGRAAFEWLQANAFAGDARVRLDVLIGNTAAIGFWHAVGFHDYCVTMERPV